MPHKVAGRGVLLGERGVIHLSLMLWLDHCYAYTGLGVGNLGSSGSLSLKNKHHKYPRKEGLKIVYCIDYVGFHIKSFLHPHYKGMVIRLMSG